ncbi:MAG TPA: ABC transporter ATP-binding protein [Phycisphaerales bacterium]|nr:ABC transporter ATP-binding protein [Phycisphaerales bacterium]HMP36804.1 ABC transporter ATP-binding protein [Phycisphaerales bacterium]
MIRPAPSETAVVAASPALSIRELRFRYGRSPGDGAPFELDLPELSLAPGEQLLLAGKSGSGKSTLLQLVAGLLDPDAGSIRVAGVEVHALTGPARDLFRGRSIGMIFQTFQLLSGFTAIENVMLAMLAANLPRAEHRPRAAALLRALGIDRPDRPVDRLSVGQQQRVAVARALACRPALVLADEPTASLDPENAANAMTLISAACRDNGAALLVTSHDPAMADRFERRITLEARRAEDPEALAR